MNLTSLAYVVEFVSLSALLEVFKLFQASILFDLHTHQLTQNAKPALLKEQMV